jgi:hypothetical protein
MKDRRPDPLDERPVRRPWDNTGLRDRVEGRRIDGIDVLALQSSVVRREADRPRRRFRSR